MEEKFHYEWEVGELLRWLCGEMPITRQEQAWMKEMAGMGDDFERLRLLRYRILAVELGNCKYSDEEWEILRRCGNEETGRRRIINRRSHRLNERVAEYEERMKTEELVLEMMSGN